MNPEQKKFILDSIGNEFLWDNAPPKSILPVITLALCQAKAPKSVVRLANKLSEESAFKESDIKNWMEVVRERLGMPKPKPGKRSNEHRDALRKWWEQNGSPAPESILEGHFDNRLRAEAATDEEPVPGCDGTTGQTETNGERNHPGTLEALRADGWVKLGEETIYVRPAQGEQNANPGAPVATDVWCGSSNPREGNGRWIRQVFQPFNPEGNPTPPTN
jgi:hypothetical protein